MFNRTVVEENHYLIELHHVAEEYERVFEINEGIKWELSRRPDAGEPISTGSAYRVYRSTSIGATPSFTVIYLFDPNADADHIYLHGIRANTEP